MAPIDNLLATRKALIKRALKTQGLVRDIKQSTPAHEVELLAVDVAEQKLKAEDLYEKTCTACTEEEFVAHDKDFDTVFDGLKKMQIIIMTYKEAMANANPPVNPNKTTPSSVKLEALKVPSFSGKFEEWQSFHDLFQAMVHNRAGLSGAEKLTFLKRALSGGSASQVIAAFEPTDVNYAEAWDHLKTRYDVKREIVFAHLRTFEDFRPRHQDTDSGLRGIADCIAKCIRSLKVQQLPVDQWDVILIYLALKKLDPESKKQWALELKTDLPVMTDFLQFLETRARALTTSGAQIRGTTSKPAPQSSSHHSSNSNSESRRNDPPCAKCSGSHPLYQCQEYKGLSIPERDDFVKNNKFCRNCLSSQHSTNCSSKRSCQKCGGRHHTSIHLDTVKKTPQPNPTPPTTSSSHSTSIFIPKKVVLLGTLLVNVRDVTGSPQLCRVFVDNGSESHFISIQCMQRLGLKSQKTYIPISGIGNQPGPVAKGQVTLSLESRSQSYNLNISALVIPQLSGLIPRISCESQWSHLEGLTLSDPDFHSAHPADILLGAKQFGHILLPEIIKNPKDYEAPVALNTRFGWMVMGEAPPLHNFTTDPTQSAHVSTDADWTSELDASLTRFWAQEEPSPQERQLSSNDVECEEHYLRTHTLNRDGTYTVRLPIKPNAPALGKSREAALRRFLKIEERLVRDPILRAEYGKQLEQYFALGFVEPVPPADLSKPHSSAYYMPHHVVVKPDSSTTPYRIVYDASAKTSTGVSLNDTLYTGPKLQVDLFPLLIRFMTHNIVMSADIWKFYPMTSMHPQDRDFQRFIWRKSPQEEIRDFRMTRVTFGVSAAPFLAIRSLYRLAERTQETLPHASQVIREDFLVDNLLSGASDVNSALELQAQLLQIMEMGGLKLLKWTSNSAELLQAIPEEMRDPAATHSIDEGDFVKTIGILWNPRSDTFSIQISVPELPKVTTKRTVLSSIARTFDPLGWLSPVTLRPKLLIQELWKAKLGWDEPLPLHFHQQWRLYCEELPLLRSFSLQRNAFLPPDPSSANVTHQMHGFSDGSDVAHSACVYIRNQDAEGRVSVHLLTAKSKVNPVAKPTTPRSELCGALLLAHLMTSATKAAQVKFTSTHCWTDSTVVLGRLSPEKKLPIYELNRIRKIMSLYPAQHWKHVSGDENPADAPSRGISAAQLLNHPLWLHGPSWLMDPVPDILEVQASVSAVLSAPISDMIRNCSSFPRLKIRMGYIIRFFKNCRAKNEERTTGPLTILELDTALTTIVKVVQAEAFPAELDICRRSLPHKAPLKFLTPFLDKHGVMRVGGRLEFAKIPFSQKHPALLPKNHLFCDVLARHYHQTHLHAGPKLLLAILREEFWIVRGPNLVKKIVQKCVTCHHHSAKVSTQLMGQLPFSRVNPSPPFSKVGVDYAGPFQLALRTGRKPPMVKAYVAVFVCMATKAAHLELVSNLSTSAFIAALNRFISRRGLPSDVYSDEGTNFVGAKMELDELLALITSSPHHDATRALLTPKGIAFHTNPPAAPHHGGLWEAAVKKMKFHLKRVIGNRHLTTEEFNTLLCQIEAILNSRPLTQMSDDPNETSALTPGHFLVGRALVALPHPDLTELPPNRLDRWQMLQRYLQDIWKSFSRDYLSTLQSRPKWYMPLPDLAPGILVLLLDNDSKIGPQTWRLGRITYVSPGDDDKTRVCDVMLKSTVPDPKDPLQHKVKSTVLRRSISKVSPLPIY